MNMEAITLEDCILHHEVNHCYVILNDGHVLGFIEEERTPLNTPYIYFPEHV